MSYDLLNKTSCKKEDLNNYLMKNLDSKNPITNNKTERDNLLVGIMVASVKYGINPIYILAHAGLESEWFTSKICQDKHNIFGYGAIDSDPYNSAYTFKSFSECINFVMGKVKVNYLIPGGAYYVSPTLEGMNVHYASDKKWAEKINSIMKQIYDFCGLPDNKTPTIPILNSFPTGTYQLKTVFTNYQFVDFTVSPPKNYFLSGEKGKRILILDLDRQTGSWVNENPMFKQNNTTPLVFKFIDGNKVITSANNWVGREFNPGEPAQCMAFTRRVLSDAGYNPGITNEPDDKNLIPQGESITGINLANSLCGDDIGMKVKREDLQNGDIVFFKNTYGDYPDGVITHVGIYDNGYVIHRRTLSAPVERVNMLQKYGDLFVEGRRLYNK